MNVYFFSWFVIAVSFAILEMGSPGLFYFLSFSIGAIVAALVSLFTESLIVQSLTFLLATICSLGLLRLWIAKRAEKYHILHHTNIYALQGKRAQVIKSIAPDAPGQVKINGEIWLARSYDSEVIQEGEPVEVIMVSGAHVIVAKIHNKS